MLDVAALGDDPGARAAELFAAGVDWIQLRDRSVETDRLFAAASALVEAARDARRPSGPGRPERTARVVVNRRLDVALAAGADGVHLGFDAVAARDARRLLPDTARIGRSLHSEAEIEQAIVADPGIDHAHLAPIWDPLSKPATRPALGLARLRDACTHGLPVIAQGGLDPARARAAIEAGAAGIAVTGSVTASSDPTQTIRALREALDGARSEVLDGARSEVLDGARSEVLDGARGEATGRIPIEGEMQRECRRSKST